MSAEPLQATDRGANCGAAFAVPRPRFYPACGQESNIRPPRLGEFLQQFGAAYFDTEGALWRTLKLKLLLLLKLVNLRCSTWRGGASTTCCRCGCT